MNTQQAIDKLRELAHELFIKEEQGVEGLVLSGGSDLPFDRQMMQKGTDFRSAHILGGGF